MKNLLTALLAGLLLFCGIISASAEGAGWYQVNSNDPWGYCYLYSAPSDRDENSDNLGRYENGEVVYVMDYNGGWDGRFRYCRVQTMDGQTG